MHNAHGSRGTLRFTRRLGGLLLILLLVLAPCLSLPVTAQEAGATVRVEPLILEIGFGQVEEVSIVLADAVPARATAILARGRAYGESRIVCGAHNASAVEAGRLSATVTLAAVRNKAAYARDLKAARAEIRALFKSRKARKPLACDAETALVSRNIFAPAN